MDIEASSRISAAFQSREAILPMIFDDIRLGENQ